MTLIVFGIVLKFGWTAPAISSADTRTTEQLKNILDLVRDQRWTTARQAIETYEKSALNNSERQQAADVRTRFVNPHARGWNKRWQQPWNWLAQDEPRTRASFWNRPKSLQRLVAGVIAWQPL